MTRKINGNLLSPENVTTALKTQNIVIGKLVVKINPCVIFQS